MVHKCPECTHTFDCGRACEPEHNDPCPKCGESAPRSIYVSGTTVHPEEV